MRRSNDAGVPSGKCAKASGGAPFGTDKVALFEALEGILVACRENKLVRFAHNWNDGTME